MHHRRLMCSLLLGLGLTGCSDYIISEKNEEEEGTPDIEVVPSEVTFQTVAPGCTDYQTITITNVGITSLEVKNLSTTGDTTIMVESFAGILEPGQAQTVNVRFLPTHDGSASATVIVASDDPDEPEVAVPSAGEASAIRLHADTFTQAASDIDVLWVIDNSSSMGEEQARVQAAINGYFSYFQTLNLDYHMGVVTSDIVTATMAGRLQGEPKFIDTTTVSPEVELAEAINVGTEDQGDESGLAAAELALSEPLLSTDNAGFLREDARLSIIWLSDEPEQSAEDAAHYIEFIDTLKSDPDYFILAAIVGDPTTGCTTKCEGVASSATDGSKYADVVAAFGGVFESICTCDLGPALMALGAFSTEWLIRFPLSSVPIDPTEIVVTVDGAITFDWVYEADTNSVVFNVPPPEGSAISVQYDLDASCN